MSNYLGLKNTGAKYTQVTTQPGAAEGIGKSYTVKVANPKFINKIAPLYGFYLNKVRFNKKRTVYTATFKRPG
jgi:nucleoside-triphosphatase THEP1